MNTFLLYFGEAIALFGRALFYVAVLLAVVALVDWLVRTRRVNPFNPVARFFRRVVDPLLVPMERRVVLAGGMPQSAPWWMLVAVVVGGILVLAVLRFLFGEIASAGALIDAGPRGVLVLLIDWTFSLLRLALIVRVASGWLRVSPYSPWVRWSYALSEPILRPLRSVIPPLGAIDVSPLIAYLALRLIEGIILSAVR